jgi:hypothetical protein
MVFQLPGGPSITILCQPAAAISKALFACSCHSTYLKSVVFSIISSQSDNFLKSNKGAISKALSLFKNCIISDKLSTGITSIFGIIDASNAFSFGINILLNHFS